MKKQTSAYRLAGGIDRPDRIRKLLVRYRSILAQNRTLLSMVESGQPPQSVSSSAEELRGTVARYESLVAEAEETLRVSEQLAQAEREAFSATFGGPKR